MLRAPSHRSRGQVNLISCDAWSILYWTLRIFWVAMLIYAVVSWVPSLQGRWSQYVARIVEPVLQPLRRLMPPVGGLDLSFLVVILLIGFALGQIRNLQYSYCTYQ
jgi:YggT family protein